MIFFKHKYVEAPEYVEIWVTWNVGQGQWVSHIQSDSCSHYDVGGEFGSFKKIKKALLTHCGRKLNRLSISHWDYDHFSNLHFLARQLPRLCWLLYSNYGTQKASVQKLLQLSIPQCPQIKNSLFIWVPTEIKNTNDSSVVIESQGVLLPGDSSIKQERQWVPHFQLQKTEVLILGHHGSRTSSGKILIEHLPSLAFAISSARYARFRHPHPDVVQRLRRAQIPVIRTEDWGNIWFKTYPKRQKP
ncbi:ComEC/Rec2 family competence protein [Pseudobdellovibrio exovorus]|nr:hydrolase [Pseudobdellovibrio exovorus]